MQFDANKSFGYPVLRTLLQGEDVSLLDYTRANFDPSISKPQWNVSEDPDHFKITYDLGLNVKSLVDAVKRSDASMYLYTLCKKTFFSKLTRLEEQKGTVKFASNLFRYDIELSAYVIANRTFELTSDRFHPDFGDDTFGVTKGDVLAWSQPNTYSCEKQQYRTMKSVFELAESSEVPIGKFILKTDADYVAITVNPEFYISIRRFETTENGKEQLLGSLFIPAVMQLLMEYKDNIELSEQYKWASVLGQKCRDLGLDLEQVGDYANFAQDLLKLPLHNLVKRGVGA